MFESQFGLRENPFAAGHQSRFVYPSREHQEALAHLRFGIENREPFVLITGEVGTGKTTALYDVLAEYESRAVVALITNSALTRDEMLEEICLRFGLPSAGQMSKPQALVALEAFLKQTRARGQHAILILDEAQNLERNLLEEIRMLSNVEDHGTKLIQIFLVGQPELEEKLAQAELRQLRQRITVFYRLSPLSLDDTERYIHHRISVAGGHALSIFPADACREVFEITHGIPREINTVAGQAMLNAFVEDSPVVKPEHVRIVERDSEFKSVLRGGGARISTLDASEGAANAPGAANVAGAAQPPAAAANTPAPASPTGPPPLIPAEPPAATSDAAPSPAHGGPPPLHPAEPEAPPPSATAPPAGAPESARAAHTPAPATHAAGPSHATPSPTPPASDTSNKPPNQQRRPGAPAPAGTAQEWGTWLSSLAHLPSTFDDKLADDLAAVTQVGPEASSTPSPGAVPPAPVTGQAPAAPPRAEPARADVSAPASATRAEPAPPRAEPPARSDAPAPGTSRVESAPSPRSEPPARWQDKLSDSPRFEPAPSASKPAREEITTIGESVHAAAMQADHAESHHDVPPASPADSTSGAKPTSEEQWLPDWNRQPRRLEFVEEEPTVEGAKTLRLMLVAGVIAVVAIGGVLGVRAWRSAAKHAQSQAASAVPSATTTVDASASSPATSADPGASSTPVGAAPAPSVTPPVVTPPPSPARGTHSSAVASAQTSTTTAPASGQRTTASSSTQSSPTRTSSTTPSTAGTQSGGTTAAAGTAGGASPVAGGAAAGGAAAGSVGGAAAGGATASGASGGAAASSGTAGGAGVSGASAGGAAPSAASGAPAASSASASPPTSATPSGSANGASAGSAQAPASQGAFGIAVGTYLFEDRAEEERVKLSASTSLPARVVTVTENDGTEYRLVLGSFDSRRSAERAASNLIEKGLVDEARVVPLSSTTASKQ